MHGKQKSIFPISFNFGINCSVKLLLLCYCQFDLETFVQKMTHMMSKNDVKNDAENWCLNNFLKFKNVSTYLLNILLENYYNWNHSRYIGYKEAAIVVILILLGAQYCVIITLHKVRMLPAIFKNQEILRYKNFLVQNSGLNNVKLRVFNLDLFFYQNILIDFLKNSLKRIRILHTVYRKYFLSNSTVG